MVPTLFQGGAERLPFADRGADVSAAEHREGDGERRGSWKYVGSRSCLSEITARIRIY